MSSNQWSQEESVEALPSQQQQQQLSSAPSVVHITNMPSVAALSALYDSGVSSPPPGPVQAAVIPNVVVPNLARRISGSGVRKPQIHRRHTIHEPAPLQQQQQQQYASPNSFRHQSSPQPAVPPPSSGVPREVHYQPEPQQQTFSLPQFQQQQQQPPLLPNRSPPHRSSTYDGINEYPNHTMYNTNNPHIQNNSPQNFNNNTQQTLHRPDRVRRVASSPNIPNMHQQHPPNNPTHTMFNPNPANPAAASLMTSTNNSNNHTTAPTSTPAQQGAAVGACQVCGMDVTATYRSLETARRQLELWHERIEVDQELLGQDKKNFKRRLKGAKLAVTRSQQKLAAKERQRQLEWASMEEERDARLATRLAEQQKQYDERVAQSKISREQAGQKHAAVTEQLQREIASLSLAVDAAHAAQQATAAQLQERQATAPSVEQTERLEELERELQDKSLQMESMEMQLLELERERDAVGKMGFGGGENSCISCAKCTSLDRQLADANLQIDTLSARQSVADQKLSAERRKYEDLYARMEAARAKREEEVKENDQRLRMAKELKEMQQQLRQTQVQQEESEERAESLEEKLASLKVEHDSMQEKLSSQTKANVELEEQVKLEQEKATLALATVAATKRAFEDSAASASAGVDVLSNATVVSNDAMPDSDRKLVMEHEWHGSEWVGIYTGQLSIRTKNPDGNGTLRLDDGSIYDGDWSNGQPHGRGVLATIEGDLHTSQWCDGQKHGLTVDVWSDGRVYRGEYQTGQRHGRGVLTWPYGAHYDGEFRDSQRNGHGVYVYADGRCYTGTYKEDRPHGYGKMTAADGSIVYDGMWQMGEFIGSNSTTTTD